MKCLVSGATGFIGRELCEQLTVRGNKVVALSKSGGTLPNGQPTIACDLSTEVPDNSVWQDVDVCFHLAGIAHRKAQEPQYRALNSEATLRLAHAAAAAGVRCFIFLSSVKAMGSPAKSGPRSEGDTILPEDPYGFSKWQAEQALRQEFSDTGMSVVIVRPALVYGCGVKGNLRVLASAARWGLPRPPAGGERSMIAVEDLVALLLMLAQQPPAGVNTWIACSNERISTRFIYDLMRSALGKSTGTGWLPRWGWQLLASTLDAISGRRGDSTYEKLFGTELYSNAAVEAATGWRPQIKLEQAIAQIAMGDSGR